MTTEAQSTQAQSIESQVQALTQILEQRADQVDWSKLLALLVQYLPLILEWAGKLFPKTPAASNGGDPLPPM